MASRTRKEVLQLADQYREKLGPKAHDFHISDDWGNVTTTAGLLIRDPAAWQSHLTDDINEAVYDTILYWLNPTR